MLNSVVLIGRLTQDPELRYTAAGVALCHFTLAVDRRFTNQQGERGTDFIDIVCWRQEAERVAQYLTKGRTVAVQGRLQIRSYETAEGQRRKAAEIVADSVQFLDRPKRDGAGEASATGGEGGPEFKDEQDEDVPF